MHYVNPVVIIVNFVHRLEVNHAQKNRNVDPLHRFETLTNCGLVLKILDESPDSLFTNESIAISQQSDLEYRAS